MNHLQWSERQSIINLLPMVISISFAMDVFVPAIPEMTDYFHSSNQAIQASLYLFMITVALAQLIIGPLSDQFGRRRTAQASAVLFLVGSMLASQAATIPILLTARVLQAIGACGTYLLCFIVIRDNFSTKACGRLFSLLTGLNSVIASSAPVLGGILLDATHSWRSAFYFLSLLGIIIFWAVFKNIPAYPQQRTPLSVKGLSSTYFRIARNPSFLQYTLSAASGLLGLYLFCAISPEILISQFHNSGSTYGLWFGLNAITVFIANMVAARLTKKISLSYLVNAGLGLIVLGASAMILLNNHDGSSVTFMLPMLCLTAGIGSSMGCSIALALDDYEDLAGTATALVSACQFGVSGCIGYLVAKFTPSPWLIAFPVLVLTLISLAWNFRLYTKLKIS